MAFSTDDFVFEYQNTGDSSKLVPQYKNFLNKYISLLWNDTIDFNNYDIRCFIACFIEDSEIRMNLRRGKFHSNETKKTAQQVLHRLRFKIRNHSFDELQSELIIPFLSCAAMYKSQGRSFEKYLYVAYKYELKRHLDALKLDILDRQGVLYIDVAEENDWKEKMPEELIIHFDTDLELNDPRWIYGDKASKPFSCLKPHERYIMAKYYFERYTDKEIAKMLPYNPKSIHRIRMRVKRKILDMYQKGEINWIRL
ncbi:sigma-70 family RNA polymerase sigma factor [Bacillus velezensis]|uniref:sigma-70 family RNA polymerase sigma factor n=1 Tax=Bacillus velezensis TaxID=492670 RepID=UPI001E475929|nr:sigma-70 family RNA polymerase sigma factor [Bacillus velezensis]MCD7910905.1 sigma-70 family RNA polymerase sigma factor [Bacillus velezensis]